MKKSILFGFALCAGIAALCQNKTTLPASKMPFATSAVKTTAEIGGTWMYGNFSTNEYWSRNPNTYLGNAFSMAIAFVFKPDGTYEQYFTSQATNVTGATYHQSLTKGAYTVDEATKTIATTALSSHYKRTRGGVTEEDRDMRPEEIAKKNEYTYTTGTEPNGTKALYVTIKGKQGALTFLKKAL